jgi:hypothetical protein
MLKVRKPIPEGSNLTHSWISKSWNSLDVWNKNRLGRSPYQFFQDKWKKFFGFCTFFFCFSGFYNFLVFFQILTHFVVFLVVLLGGSRLRVQLSSWE